MDRARTVESANQFMRQPASRAFVEKDTREGIVKKARFRYFSLYSYILLLWLDIFLIILLGAIELCLPPTSLLFQVSVDFPEVLIDAPTFPPRSELHYNACLVVSVAGLRSVGPTEVNFQLAISEGMSSFPLLLQSFFLLTFPGYVMNVSGTFREKKAS